LLAVWLRQLLGVLEVLLHSLKQLWVVLLAVGGSSGLGSTMGVELQAVQVVDGKLQLALGDNHMVACLTG
jgi:hypothetical protein